MAIVKKFNVIAKVGNKPTGEAKTVSYVVNNLIKFTAFLDKEFPTWSWMNVFDFKTEAQIASFTKFKKPTVAWLTID